MAGADAPSSGAAKQKVKASCFEKLCRLLLFLLITGGVVGSFVYHFGHDRTLDEETGGSTTFKTPIETVMGRYARPPLRLPLLSWEEAEAKAEETLRLMSAMERHLLMRGIGWKQKIFFGDLKDGFYMGTTPPIPRLSIPPLKLHDAGNGFRNNPSSYGGAEAMGSTTCWPSALALAASWDEEVAQKTAKAIGREFRGKGSNVILGPAVQVHRVARNGRNFEYLSGEDPYLGSRLAAAYVRGVQSENVIATVKHFAFNEQETDRNNQSSNVDERTAWELYYPPFEAAIAAGAGAFMCSYNRVNGTHACQNEQLLKRDLKEKMGFRGFVMSDWWALHATASVAVPAGLDQEMPGIGAGPQWERDGPWFTHERLEAGETGTPVPGILDRVKRQLFGDPLVHKPRDKSYFDPARRILTAMWRSRLFELPGCDPGTDCIPSLMSDQRSVENADLAKEGAIKGTVLLQNDGILPLRKENGFKSIALVGEALVAQSLHKAHPGQFMPPADLFSGGGSGHVGAGDGLINAYEGITRRAAAAGVEVHVSGSRSTSEAMLAAEKADVVVVVAGTWATEMYDRYFMHLDSDADAIITAVSQKKPTIVLLQLPGVTLMPWRSSVAAIAVQFMGGEKTGEAWASLLFGDFNPSAKLPIMLPKTEEGTVLPGTAHDVWYSEGLFTSYRSRNADDIAAFPFGHGLSFTDFTYGIPVQLPAASCPEPFVACVKVTVTNIGRSSWSGAEVAQAYVQFPKEVNAPRLMLKGFHKTKELPVNTWEEVYFNFTARDLSVYLHGGWRLQEKVLLHIGASSADLRRNITVVANTAQAKDGCVAPWATQSA